MIAPCPPPHQPYEANPRQRIFAEIIRDFKVYHTSSNPELMGAFSLEEKLLNLADIFDVFNEECYNDSITFARLYVTSNLKSLLCDAIRANEQGDIAILKKRIKLWGDGTPARQDLLLFEDTAREILYRYCFQRNIPVLEPLNDCEFIKKIKSHLG